MEHKVFQTSWVRQRIQKLHLEVRKNDQDTLKSRPLKDYKGSIKHDKANEVILRKNKKNDLHAHQKESRLSDSSRESHDKILNKTPKYPEDGSDSNEFVDLSPISEENIFDDIDRPGSPNKKQSIEERDMPIIRGYAYELIGHQTDNADKEKPYISFLSYVTVLKVHVKRRNGLHHFRRQICSGSIETKGSSCHANAVIVFLKQTPRISVQKTTRWYYLSPVMWHVTARLFILQYVIFKGIDKKSITEEVILNKENKDDEILDERRVTKVFRVKMKRQEVRENDERKNDKHATGTKQGPGLFYEMKEVANYDDANVGYEISFFNEDETRPVSKLTLSSDFTASFQMTVSEVPKLKAVDIDIDENNLIEIVEKQIAEQCTEEVEEEISSDVTFKDIDKEPEAVVANKENGEADILEESREIKVYRVKIKGQELSENNEPKTFNKDQHVAGTDQELDLLSDVKESGNIVDVDIEYEISFFNKYESRKVSNLTLSSDFASSYQTTLSDAPENVVVDIDIDENKRINGLECSTESPLLNSRYVSFSPSGFPEIECYTLDDNHIDNKDTE